MSLAILLYSILFLQVYKLQMFARASVDATPSIFLSLPMVNTTCESATEDCVEVVHDSSDLKNFSYCAKNPNLNVSGCVPAYGMFAPGLHTQLVSTMATKVDQVRSDFRQPWSTSRIRRYYVVGAEFARVGIVHDFNHKAWSRSGMVGLLDSLKEPLCQLPCKLSSGGKDCNVPILAPGCNHSDILNLPWGDYLPLHLLLAAAGHGLGPCGEALDPLRSSAFLGRRLRHRHRVFRHRLHRLLDEGQLGPNTEIRDPPSPDDRGGAAVLRT
mmetsp:Transcript_109340/g.348947  ORF Transcript_109340/g.348947 Transcript_109340/m.348947 type:complete len:270 (-) Transcript_109340:176-985(-)